jgi:4-hydroxy-tetrahydrodipicolinate synthase
MEISSVLPPFPLFRGVGVALVTLFNRDGSVDAAATAALAEQLVGLGVRAVLVAGSTGEAASLAPEERTALVQAVRSVLPPSSGVPLLAGSGAPTAEQAAELTRCAKDDGADAVLALSPPGSEDLPGYYETVATAAAPLPVLGYHFPSVSGPGIPIELLDSLPIHGLKDSTADADRLFRTVTCWDWPLYTGSSALVALAGAVGAAGAILALANVKPELCEQAFEGSLEAQRDIVADHLAAKATFPSGIKELTAQRFGTSRVARSASP